MGRLLFRRGRVIFGKSSEEMDVLVEGEKITAVGKNLEADGAAVVDISGKYLFPGTIEQLDARILRDFEEEKNKQFKNSLSRLLPAKLIPVMIRRSQIPPEKQVNEITREERRHLAQAIKEFSFTITGTRSFTEAIITQGGLSVKEINPSTMESKKAKHLYFAGEMLDTDAVTGGYNLQIAWSTGWTAGNAVP